MKRKSIRAILTKSAKMGLKKKKKKFGAHLPHHIFCSFGVPEHEKNG